VVYLDASSDFGPDLYLPSDFWWLESIPSQSADNIRSYI
jgi:hypothetical protein